jgi:hypothetical protein
MYYALFVPICGIMEVILLSAIVCNCYIAGIQANTEQNVKKLGLCRVLAHGKETICPLMCAGTRQTCHALTTCALLAADLLPTWDVQHTA